MPTSIALNPHFEDFIRQQVDSGCFMPPGAALRSAANQRGCRKRGRALYPRLPGGGSAGYGTVLAFSTQIIRLKCRVLTRFVIKTPQLIKLRRDASVRLINPPANLKR
ncbi:hypothetical protein Thi970DRAFT_01441 [Thiorhodovibrio frisius]|uniref:Uncharacterized protein n=1 Tax=Thiorhodovibrio frisius TaxID=631362 RepID=H8Z0E9_9GAMM|nr:hypothetical protein Thi970DRAFT_01441 [Thiorhodovibrio frisius]WPL23826.1 hypothetical protein Thiofri_04032 [Thiorhodovibrio frisius]